MESTHFFQISNDRLASLSSEIDEHNLKQEELLKKELQNLELRHQEQMRILKKSNEIELDIKTNLIEEQQRYALFVANVEIGFNQSSFSDRSVVWKRPSSVWIFSPRRK